MRKYKDGKITGLKIAYVGGGSRGWAWNLMRDLASQEEISGQVFLYDIDAQAAENNAVIGNRLTAGGAAKSRWDYSAAHAVKQALDSADIVVCSILPGTFDQMQSDVHTPEKYGIYQSVGDTTGPGGLIRAMRTIPMFAEIAQAVKTYCPDAWLINYTNPMSLCIGALYKVFPDIKAFGCCHEVFGVQKLLGFALEEIEGISGVTRHDVRTTVTGINHFTWITQAQYEGIDLIPVYREFAQRFYKSGYEKDDDGTLADYFHCSHRVKFDLFLENGAIAAAGDRHLAEFSPGGKYLKDPETIKQWGFRLTPVSWRKEDLAQRLTRSARLLSGEETLEATPSGEEGVQQLKAVLGLGDMITNVNLPNLGQIPNLPLGVIVETNASFTANGVKPICCGAMDDNLLRLMSNNVFSQDKVITSALHKDPWAAFPVFANDPLISHLSYADARALYRTMLENTAAYLPGFQI